MTYIQRNLLILLCSSAYITYSMPPAGLFAPYDINLRHKKPSPRHFQFNILGENSYKIQGYATDEKEEKTFAVNALEIYEPTQNIVALYQGYDAHGSIIQTLNTPFTQFLDSIAGGPGGGVANKQNGLFQPSGNLSCGQIALQGSYGLGHGFYLSGYVPFYFAKLSDVTWTYLGNNALFSDIVIQQKLINSFTQDAQKYFDLNVGNWKKRGIGDIALIAEWQRDFPQQRPTLKNVQANARLGITLPTSCKNNTSMIMPIDFGADGTVSHPFGGGLSMNLGNMIEVGFSGQFWYYWSHEKLRRIKTFPTQTTLLLPITTTTFKEYAITQNFNLHGIIYSFCKRFMLKGFYQYWRKGKDTIITKNSNIDFNLINSALNLEEETRHQFCLLASYSPLQGDFTKCIPQFQIFWKTATNGMRTALASTYGAQLSLTF